eukprot:TRINITY_DN16197_c0_g1_i5.p1 TRINITY_DN16197_c0_g1~~TRINITY_DN16197_c0_g1_i5.p1  ORF type:complete len:366 (-),score=44.07 TRINITY_DN16197_c0_g1_i5:103-1200(-)
MPRGLLGEFVTVAAADEWLQDTAPAIRSISRPRLAFNTAFDSHAASGGKEVAGTKNDAVAPEQVLDYMAGNGRKVKLNGDNVKACVKSCETAPELSDTGDTKEAELTVASQPDHHVQDCIAFCKLTLQSPACFSGSSSVLVRQRGRANLADLRIGDVVLTAKPEPSRPDGLVLCYERVLDWLHRDPLIQVEFVRLRLCTGAEVHLTADHLIFVRRSAAVWPVRAQEVVVGDGLLVPWVDGSMASPKVVEISSVERRGIYAPLVDSGVLLVDGAVTSCYALPDNLAQAPALCLLAESLGARCFGCSVQHTAQLLHLPLRLRLLPVSREIDTKALPLAEQLNEQDRRWQTIHPYSKAMYLVASAILT